MQNTTGNHVEMCFLEEFPMLSTKIFRGSLEIPEGITSLARFRWTQIQTKTRTKNGSKQRLVVMDLCLKADGLLN